MNLEQIRNSIQLLLKESRYRHSVGVEEVACDLAVIYGYDCEKASIAGILHDCAKYLTDEELIAEGERYHLPIRDIEYRCGFLLHAKVGATYAKEKYGIEEEDMLNAITYHTTGRPGMSLLEKIIFTSDYIEPYRKPLPRIDEIRNAAYHNLDLAVLMILENMLNYLKATSAQIDTLTEETYQYYKSVIQMDTLE